MNKWNFQKAFLICLSFFLVHVSVFAQGANSKGLDMSLPIIAVVILAVFAIMFKIGSSYRKVSQKGSNTLYKLNSGFDINMMGSPADKQVEFVGATTASINPKDFRGLSPIPKVEVSVGDEVKAGDVIFYDKKLPEIKFTAPVSGEVVEIRRGEKRSIADIVILVDKTQTYRKFDINIQTREAIVATLLESGLWTYLVQRPFGHLAEINEVPRDIFISTFSTAPMAVDSNIVVEGREADLQKAIDVLTKLTSGSVYLGLNGNASVSPVLSNAKNCKINYFSGPHPAGNVGIQIHNVAPIKKGEVVWTMGLQEMLSLGKLFNEGILDTGRIVSLGGNMLQSPKYIKTYQGANVEQILANNTKADATYKARIISGDVLTGKKIENNGFMAVNHDQLSVIKEGDQYEFLGWLMPSYPRPSISATYPWVLSKSKKFDVNTNTYGEKRAYVVTGQYEEVLPMSIYPVNLMKAIIANDFDKIEGLGIYELLEEDVALCEFVCTSKQAAQQTLRKGMEFIISQS